MFYSLLAQQATEGGSGYSSFVLMGLMLLVLYLFIIRPQQRRQRKQKQYIADIKEGDPIVTLGGLHAKVISLSKDTLVVEIDKGTKATLERSAISYEASARRATAANT